MSDLVCVKITGLNLLRIVDKLVENGVSLTQIVSKSKSIKFLIFFLILFASV